MSREHGRKLRRCRGGVKGEVVDGDEVALGHVSPPGADEHDLGLAVALVKPHADALFGGRGQVLADAVRPDGQLAVTVVDEDRELHDRRPAVVERRIDGGADRAPGDKNIVDEHHGGAVDVEGQVRVLDDRLRRAGDDADSAARRDIVPVGGDVEVALVVGATADLAEQLVDALAEEGAARVGSPLRQAWRRRGSSRGSRERCA